MRDGESRKVYKIESLKLWNGTHNPNKCVNKRIASSGASLPKGDRRSRGLWEEPCRAWNSFGNNIEEYATTNETDFMGSVTMSPASGTM